MELSERGTISDLVHYRIETAKSDLKSANILMNEQIIGHIMRFII